MQSCIGKRRSYQGTRKSRVLTYACISIIFTSCSLFPKKISQSDKKSLANLKQSVCKSASGRGRVKVSDQVNRFSFQSELKPTKFLLGIDIPFKGQETLDLDLNSKELSGSLYSKMSKSLMRSKRYDDLKAFDTFLHEIVDFFSAIQQMPRCNKENCLGGEFKSSKDSSMHYVEDLGGSVKFYADFEKLNGHYKRIRIKAQETNSESSLMQLDLIIDECH